MKRRPKNNTTTWPSACAVWLLALSPGIGQQTIPQAIAVAPGDEKTVGFATENPGDTYQLDVTPDGEHRFRRDGGDNILGENTDGALWQRSINTDQHKQFKVTSANIHDGHEAVFNFEFLKPKVTGGGGGKQSDPPDAYVKAVNCFVKIHTPGSIAAPGALIPAPTQVGKPYTGILQRNTDDEISAGIEDHTSGSKTGDGLTKDNDLVKVELSWNPITLRPDMVKDKVLQLVLPTNTKAYLSSGAALTDMTVTIGSASGQLAELGGSARKQNIFIEGNAAWAVGVGTREIMLKVDGLDMPGAEAKALLQPADLMIHSGQSAPLPVIEKDEEKIGAFTVANLNDTDGDGTVDNVDTVVKKGAAGTDEEDLMQLVVKGPAQGRMKITVMSGDLAFWEKSTKETAIAPQGNAVFLDCAVLPKTLWVEATDHSTALRDIALKLGWESPDGQLVDDLDNVTATAVWAEKTSVKKANGDALWTEAGDPLKTTFIDYLGGVFGPNMNAPFGEFHFSIGIEFTVLPTGVGAEPGVAFDITRDKAFRDWSINGGVVQNQFSPGSDDVFDQGDVSDDDHISESDEDVIPKSDKIYTIDGPGEKFVLYDQVVSRSNFEEFVRVSFSGSRPSGENDDGSRCSANIPWHVFYWVEKDPASADRYRMRAGKMNEVDEGHLSFGNAPTP